MNKILPLKSVYSYYYPQTQRLVDSVVKKYPHEVFLRSIKPGLDDFHESLINTYIQGYKDQLPKLSLFPYHYITSGGSEAIFHLLALIATSEKDTPVYVFEGEYEGFAGYGQNLGINVIKIKFDTNFKSLAKGIFFISNPSARDGNIIPNSKIKSIADSGHRIILDLTYVGMTKPHKFLIHHKSIIALIISLSKPYGIYYHRVGMVFSNIKIDSLWANKWFKNIFSLILAEKLIKKYPNSQLASKYSTYQKKATEIASKQLGIEIKPSDVYLLGYSKEKPKKSPHDYFRGDNCRYCFTSYYLSFEKHQ